MKSVRAVAKCGTGEESRSINDPITSVKQTDKNNKIFIGISLSVRQQTRRRKSKRNGFKGEKQRQETKKTLCLICPFATKDLEREFLCTFRLCSSFLFHCSSVLGWFRLILCVCLWYVRFSLGKEQKFFIFF